MRLEIGAGQTGNMELFFFKNRYIAIDTVGIDFVFENHYLTPIYDLLTLG